MNKNAPLKNILLLLSILALMLVSGGTIFAFFGGAEMITKWRMPPVVPVVGTIMMDGQPMTIGNIVTYPEDPSVPGSVGFVDTSGRFQLETDVNGQWTTGAYAGVHKVTVQVRPRVRGQAQGPELLLNADYGDVEKTPLRLVIARNPDGSENRSLLLDLKGGLRDFHVEGDPEPEATVLAESMLKIYDINHDKVLDSSEQAKIEIERGKDMELANCDTNQDGVADEQELMESARRVIAKEVKKRLGATNERAERTPNMEFETTNPIDQGAELNARFFEIKVMGFYDLDMDDRLSKEELDKIDSGMSREIRAADKDQDGFVDAKELHVHLFNMGRELMLRSMGKNQDAVLQPKAPDLP